MQQEDSIDYHTNRANTELDLGLMASHRAAARAHLELASMHRQRLRELGVENQKPLLRM